jgi:hypothetical protein
MYCGPLSLLFLWGLLHAPLLWLGLLFTLRSLLLGLLSALLLLCVLGLLCTLRLLAAFVLSGLLIALLVALRLYRNDCSEIQEGGHAECFHKFHRIHASVSFHSPTGDRERPAQDRDCHPSPEQSKQIGDQEDQQYCSKPYASSAAGTPTVMSVVASTEAKNQHQNYDE